VNDITKTNMPRYVEASNARLEIRRDDESRDDRKRKDRGEVDPNASLDWDEMASVSVMALHAFLGSLLATRLTPENPPPAVQEHAPKTSLQKQAIGAYHRNPSYQSAPSQSVNVTVGTTISSTENSGNFTLGDDFSEEDIRQIETYRHDLMELHRKGIEEIRLERSATFLQSIGNGIKEAAGN
jgi:hypothetical protein